jgi:hypothetical protein
MINITNIERWSPRFHSQIIYYKKNEPRPVQLSYIKWLPNDFRRKNFLEKKKSVYFVTKYGRTGIEPATFRDMKNVTVHTFHYLVAVEIKNRGAIKKSIVEMFETLKNRRKRNQSAYKLYEILFHLKLINKDIQGAIDNLNALKQWGKKGKLKDLVKRLDRKLKKVKKS